MLEPEIFSILEHTAPGRNNEIQLTDAMRELCHKKDMVAVDFDGQRFDTGNPRDYIATFIDFALMDEDMKDWTRQFVIEKAKELLGG